MNFRAALLAFASLIFTASSTVTNSEEALLQIYPDVKTNLVLRPPGTDEDNATLVAVSIHILDIYRVDDKAQEYSVSMYIRQRWSDPRLKFTSSNPEISYVTLNDREKLWVPDTFFVNERKTRFSDALTENSFINIYSDGKVVYSTRVHSTFACKMNHDKFPFDKQACSFTLESYGHTKKGIKYEWYSDHRTEIPLTISGDLTLRPFVLEAYGVDNRDIKANDKEYTSLQVQFLIARRGFGRYFMQVFLPISVTIVLSYLTLWVHFKWATKVYMAVIGITLTSLLAAFASSLGPETSDCNALNAWGFWSVVISSLPLVVLIASRLLTQKAVESEVNDEEKKVKDENSVAPLIETNSRVEKIAIFMIPLIFCLYNFVYWVNYIDRINMDNGLTTRVKLPYP